MCCQGQAKGVWLLPLIEGLVVTPNLLHIRPGGAGHLHVCVTIPTFQYGVRSAGVCPSRPSSSRLQKLPDFRCFLLRSPPGVHQKGPADRSGDPPHHVLTVARVLTQGLMIINQPDGILVHPGGLGQRFSLGGTGSRVLMIWNLASAMIS